MLNNYKSFEKAKKYYYLDIENHLWYFEFQRKLCMKCIKKTAVLVVIEFNTQLSRGLALEITSSYTILSSVISFISSPPFVLDCGDVNSV